MQCPIDGSTLVVAERSGVEIDYCPQCRGVWLDRGELDKIIERSAAQMAPPPPPRQAQAYDQRRRDDDHYGGQRKKRRGGFLEDLFDFD
jgi:Zn-finger nucleic acid-binding protein